MGTCGRAVGAEPLLTALREAVSARGADAEVLEGACNGMCYAAPLVEVRREGWPRFVVERLAPSAVPAFLDRLMTEAAGFEAAGLSGVVWAGSPWRGLTPVGEHPFWKGQERVLLGHSGVIDPEDLDDALRHGAYRALARALARPPAEVIETVKASGLQGRGGAFFPTGIKWEACRKAPGEPKYVVLNGEEGEPGIFKDRHLMEGDPHQVLEGVLLAAYAVGATRAILYVHGEANLSAARLARAVAKAEAAGIVGPRVLGEGVACHVELFRGAGGFVLGEETALLESIEGRRAQPRTRPPFPVEAGLWGKPTVINNVETLSAIPSILDRGAGWFRSLGTPKAPGTKVFGLSGPLWRPGVVEVRNGVTLRRLLEEIGGGIPGGAGFQGAVVGGPSGTIVPRALFDVPMEPRERVSPGTGGIVAVPEGASVVEIVKTLLRFNADESCGKCTPCREGTPRLLVMIDGLAAASDAHEVRERVRELGETIQLASLCGLGQAAPLALLRGLESFGDRFAAGR
jgi:NADH:ubiquinone oxidoreductase subunit F (NADH-binding)